MIRNVLSHIGGVEAYGIVSVLLFFAFFIGMLVWAFCLNSAHLESMRDLPLGDSDSSEPGDSEDSLSRSTSSSSSRHEFE